jgi:hypothetical protein
MRFGNKHTTVRAAFSYDSVSHFRQFFTFPIKKAIDLKYLLYNGIHAILR